MRDLRSRIGVGLQMCEGELDPTEVASRAETSVVLKTARQWRESESRRASASIWRLRAPRFAPATAYKSVFCASPQDPGYSGRALDLARQRQGTAGSARVLV
jgi:hypothetical protein